MTLAVLLENAFREHADREAVGGEIPRTYGDLAAEAGKIRDALKKLGVGPGDRVLLSREKGSPGIAALCGILLSGAAYVPADPSLPSERRRTIVKNCRPVAAVESEVIPLEAPQKGGPKDLAAILYTSGSSGTPKGVCLTHGNILYFVEWMTRTFRVGPESRLSGHAPYSFDLSLFDHFGAFSCGAAVVPVPKEANLFPALLGRFIESERLTHWYSVPFALVGLAERGALEKRDCASLRNILFAGEPFPMDSLRKLMAALPHASFANLYGPTETNVSLFHPVTREDLDQEELPVGKPAPGMEVRLDEGELLVRGEGVSSGYWGGEIRPSAWYRTGDRLRFDGEKYWFVGRMDRMLKIRGYRVEPGEVERALLADRRVKEAAAFSVAGDFGQRKLKAAVSLRSETNALELGKGLRALLPDYMVPREIEILSRLPRTETGKVDYRELR